MYVVVFIDNGDVVSVSYSEERQEVEEKAFEIAKKSGFFPETTDKEAIVIIRKDHRVTPDDDSNKLVIIKKAWRA